MNDFEKASLYAISQIDEIDIDYALNSMEKYRCPLRMVNDLADEIHDYMEEYGSDNDLPEGWWLEYGDEEDVLFKGLELKNKN